MDKLLFVLAGGGAAGKSTTSKAFAIGEPVQFKEERVVLTRKGDRPMGVNWTLYDNYALVGNHKNGTDSNTGPGAVKESFLECITARDIIIIDGFVSSPQWAQFCVDWQKSHPEHTLYVAIVHFDLTPEQLLDRLAMRRGVPKEESYERMAPRFEGYAKRPGLLIDSFNRTCPQFIYDILHVIVEHTTDEIVEMMDDIVDELFGDVE